MRSTVLSTILIGWLACLQVDDLVVANNPVLVDARLRAWSGVSDLASLPPVLALNNNPYVALNLFELACFVVIDLKLM